MAAVTATVNAGAPEDLRQRIATLMPGVVEDLKALTRIPSVSLEKVASNLGFAGGVIIDNGSAGFDMTGTGNFNTACDTPDDPLKKIAKLCYDKDMLSDVRSKYIDLILSEWVVDFNFTGTTWQEVAN